VILESIVTTVDSDGCVNIAPMGPRTNASQTEFALRPFTSSRTYRNLLATRTAVIHVTDDANLFARAAVDALDRSTTRSLVTPLDGEKFWLLKDCHRWFAVEIAQISGREPRRELRCHIVKSGIVRPFFGFNRAKHAVIEAAILATRTHLLSAAEIGEQLERLRPLIDKTAGGDEHEAFDFLSRIIDERLASQ
jgi:hypothetical protein